MKFDIELVIDAPISHVNQLYNNPNQRAKWQDGYISTELISGNTGEVGAKSRLYFKSGKHEMELIETLLEVNPPYETVALYEHSHMVNTMRNVFLDVGENKTKWLVEIEYTEFIGFIPKLMSKLFPGLFKKQGEKWFKQFKALAET